MVNEIGITFDYDKRQTNLPWTQFTLCLLFVFFVNESH